MPRHYLAVACFFLVTALACGIVQMIRHDDLTPLAIVSAILFHSMVMERMFK